MDDIGALKAKNEELLNEVKKLKNEKRSNIEQVGDELEALRAELQTEKDKSKNMLIDSALNNLLDAHNVKNQFRDMTKALFKGQININDDNALMIDNGHLEDVFSDFMNTEAGKSISPVPGNSGAGSHGSNAMGETGKPNFDNMSSSEIKAYMQKQGI